MTVSYTQVTVSGYNSSPPPDDGSTGSDNQVTWAKIKTKLVDPIKTALESIDDNVAAAIALAETDINAAETQAATNLTTLRGELNAPSGTAMLFKQTAAPTGWTKQTDQNDKALRIVSGTPSTGGSTAFSSVFAARTIAQANLPNVNFTVSATGTAASNGAHTHTVSGAEDAGVSYAPAGGHEPGDATTKTTSSDGAHTHTVSVTGTAASGGSGTAMDFAVQYVDVIYATKN